MTAFLKALEDHVVLGDGAIGTEIRARGVSPGRPYDELNLSYPELIRAIHRDYLQAGAEVLKTNTFMANPLRLRRYGLEAIAPEVTRAGVRLAREAAGREAFVAGSVGPLSDLKLHPEELIAEAFERQCHALAEGGCDLLLLETFTKAAELKIAIEAARGTGLPIVAQMASPVIVGVAAELPPLGASLVGANCMPPEAIRSAMEKRPGAPRAPFSAFPSAGLSPRYVEAASFARAAARLAPLGARLLGGCCGAGPAHIRALGQRIGR